jgi:hypothetical protein
LIVKTITTILIFVTFIAGAWKIDRTLKMEHPATYELDSEVDILRSKEFLKPYYRMEPFQSREYIRIINKEISSGN